MKDLYICQVADCVYHAQVSKSAYARGWRDKVIVAETIEEACKKFKAEGKVKDAKNNHKS